MPTDGPVLSLGKTFGSAILSFEVVRRWRLKSGPYRVVPCGFRLGSFASFRQYPLTRQLWTRVPLRLTAGCRTLNAVIVVRIHEGEPMHSQNHAGVAQRQEQRSHTAKVGCSNQPTGTNFLAPIFWTNPAVVQWPERLIVAQETAVRLGSQGPILKDCIMTTSKGA